MRKIIMTQEDKLEQAKELYKTANEDQKYVLEKLFPELIESEDERIRESLLKYLHTLPNHYAHNGVCAPEWIAWLEKQKMQETVWSEEVEDAIGMAIIALEDMYDEYTPNTTYAGYDLPFNKAAEILESLKPQNKWKPSEEQILALRWVLNNIPYNKHKEEITGLLDQIKKL